MWRVRSLEELLLGFSHDLANLVLLMQSSSHEVLLVLVSVLLSNVASVPHVRGLICSHRALYYALAIYPERLGTGENKQRFGKF